MMLLTGDKEVNSMITIQLPETYIGTPAVFVLKCFLAFTVLVVGILFIVRYATLKKYIMGKAYLKHGFSAICYSIFIFCCGRAHYFAWKGHDLFLRVGLVSMMIAEFLLIRMLKESYRRNIYFRKYELYMIDMIYVELILAFFGVLFERNLRVHAISVMLNETLICFGIVYLRHQMKDVMLRREAFLVALGIGSVIELVLLMIHIEEECLFSKYSLLPFAISVVIYLGINRSILVKEETKQMDAYVKQNVSYREEQVKLVKNQMNEHFVFNTFNMIYLQIRKEPEKARSVLNDFSKYLRYNYEVIGTEKLIPFSKELMQINTYLTIEKERFPGKIHVEWNLQTVRFKIPPLSVQTLVENAVRFGVSKKNEGGTIWIKTWTDAGNIIVEVRDNGNEASVKQLKERPGLHHLSKQFEQLDGYELLIDGQKGVGCVAQICIKGTRRIHENHYRR